MIHTIAHSYYYAISKDTLKGQSQQPVNTGRWSVGTNHF